MKYSASPSADWQAKSDMQTLLEARKIKGDPKRLKAALACAKKDLDALESITEYSTEPTKE